MTYSILSEARVQASVAEQGGSSRPYSVYWSTNKDLQDWTTFVNLDIVGAWGGFLFATKTTTSGSYIAPSNSFPPVDSQVNNHIYFRMKYDKHPKNVNPTNLGKIQWLTTADPVYDTNKTIEFEVIPDGKWHLYDLNMDQATYWVGNINAVRFFPCENGYRNDEVFLNFFEIGTSDFEFSFENERSGSPGYVMGATPLVGELTIEKDVNDKLLVNIDGYGYVQITLTPQTAQPSDIAKDLAFQLGKTAIGGYNRAQARIDAESQKLIIESGTYDSDSSVSIQYSENSAAVTLGLTDVTGYFLGSQVSGTAPAVDYVPVAVYKPTTLEITSLFDNDTDLPAFSINPQTPLVEGGRRDFAETSRKLTTTFFTEGSSTNFTNQKITTTDYLDVSGKTVVDLNHPFSDDGQLQYIYINGIPDTAGGTKWKIFRPRLDGTLDFIAEGVIGQTNIVPNPSGGLVLTTEPGVFAANVSASNVFVRRGDLLGVYNTKLHVGSFGVIKPDAMYYEFEGDVTTTVTPEAPIGAGEAGLPIYAKSSGTKRQAVVDIDLGRRLNLDSIDISGEESSTDLEYNLAVANSTNFSADVRGDHTICYVINTVTGQRACFVRPNTVFNLQALNDDVLYAENGITSFGSPGTAGLGGATTPGATYFYVNGDAEHLGVYEFQNLGPQAYDFIRDPLGIDCFFSSSTPRLDKPVGRAVIYFKDKKNQRSWQIEYSLGEGTSGGNGSKPGFRLIDEDTIEQVELDNKIITAPGPLEYSIKDGLQNLLLANPAVLDVIAADGTRNPQIGQDFTTNAGELGGVNFRDQVTFIEMQWNKFGWKFEPIRTTGFRWYSDFHWSTKISEFQVFGTSRSYESLGDNVQILFSADGESFESASLIRSSTTEASYKLANSPRYLRLIFRPTIDLTVNDVTVNFETDQIGFGVEGRIEESITVDDARVGEAGNSTPLLITNNTDQTADLILDLPPDAISARQLMYFSKLNSIEDVHYPQVGPPGRVDFIPDKRLMEEENVAIGARTYGLLPIPQDADAFTTANLMTNGDFEYGDLTGWNLTVTQSGSKYYQIPRVLDIGTPDQIDYDTIPSFQTGSYVFGFSLDNQLPYQLMGTSSPGEDEVPVHFVLETQPLDISEFAESVDLGTGQIDITFKYLTYYTVQSSGPIVRFMGSPTLSGLALSAGSTVDADYGSNLLRSFTVPQGNNVASQSSDITTISHLLADMKANTRYIKIQFVVTATGARTSGPTIRREKFLLDNLAVYLQLSPASAVRWYKSWRTGAGDFKDAAFKPVTEFTTITGSTHWYQPFNASAGTTPGAGQSLGYSNAFQSNRSMGVQSYRRMTPMDPGLLGAQWEGEKTIEGIRIVLGHNISTAFSSCSYPRRWHIEALKTRDELGGVAPDINNETHFKLVQLKRGTGPFDNPNAELLGEGNQISRGPSGRFLTWLFDAPVLTEGLRLVFTTVCDIFELQAFGGTTSVTPPNFTDFEAYSSCPDNFTTGVGFSCSHGTGAAMFQPLESIGIATLPIDNVRETDYAGSTIYAAVDLGRRYSIETNSDLLELVADTDSQSEWTTGGILYSNTETTDPNAVVWGNTSATNARWIRFQCTATEKYEIPSQLVDSSFPTGSLSQIEVINLPQAILKQARIYPSLTTALIPTQGLNARWQDLGTTLTDNSNTTFINYSDYPVIAVDLGKAYLLSNESTIFRKKHDLLSNKPVGSPTERYYWNPDDDTNFTYATKAFKSEDDPSKVTFSTYGSSPPNIPVRWVAFKGDGPLQQANNTSGPKLYLYNSRGGTLFNTSWKPRNTESFTENYNWFTTRKVGLQDISTITSELGNQFSVVEGVDYGASHNNGGNPLNAFDGRFTDLDGDVWGVVVRNQETFIDDPDFDFPHNIYRVFRDTFRGTFLTQEVRAVKIKGFNEQYYPTDFKIQSLKSSVTLSEENTSAARSNNAILLARDSSWEDIADNDFSGVDTFQSGAGFTSVFRTPVTTRGIRIYITDSVYPDDSVQTQTSDTGTGTYSTYVDTAGPETRVSEIVIYEEVLEEPALTGVIDINHMASASVSAVTSTPDHGAALVADGSISTYWQSSGFQDTLTISLAGPRTIHRLEWEKDPDLGQATGNLSTNAPSDFRLKAQVGSSYTTVLERSGFVGTTYSGTLAAPVTATNFLFEVSSVQGENENASAIQLSELRLIEQITQTTPLVLIEEAVDRHPDSPNSTSTLLRYAANTDAEVSVRLDGIDGNNDPYFSERDFFQCYLKINDIDLFDTEAGYIKLGNSAEVNYRWDIKNISGLQSGWNRLRLQFSEADDKSAIAFQSGPNYNENTGESKVDFVTEDVEALSTVDGNTSARVIQAPGIRYFEINFRGTRGSGELQLTLDDFQFSRNHFDDVCKFSTALYLNNSETFTLPIEGVDLNSGTVEFWIQPDWDVAGRIYRGESQVVIPAIFRIIKPDGSFLSLLYRPSTGFTAMVYDRERLYQFESEYSGYTFSKFDTLHFALVWDRGRKATRENASIAMYVNGEIIFGSNAVWRGLRESGASVIIGGELGQKFAAAQHNSTALTFTAVPTLAAKNTASTWALLENLKIYNYPKWDFSDRVQPNIERSRLVTPSELVEISTDNINFYSSGSDNLPLVVEDVPPGSAATVYVRTNIPKGLTGNEQRDASLLVRWKTPLRQCD